MLKIFGLITAVFLFSTLGFSHAPGDDLLNKVGPINRHIPVPAPNGYLLENPQGSHAKLWDPDYLKTHPATKTETRELVVIGAGVAGILSANEAKERDFILLEQNPYLGGNATGQEWNGVSSETGASFINIPASGDQVDALLHQIKIADKMIIHMPSDNPVMVDKVRYPKIWDTGTNPANQRQFNKIRDFYTAMGSGKKGAPVYPQIPFLNETDRAHVIALDGETARARLEKVVGGPLDPVVEAAINHWVWSDNSVTIDEASPATVDNFLGANFGGIASFPGGNAFILEATLKYWMQSGVKDVENRIRPSSLVRNIKVVKDGVDVTYIDGQGVVTLVHSKAVVFAGAKFIAAAVIEGLEPKRIEAIGNLKYRSFVTATVKINRPTPREKRFYDMYFFESDIVQAGDAQAQSEKQGATDVIGSFSESATVLTFFYPLPYDGARSMLLDPDSENVIRTKIMSQLTDAILPDLGFTQGDVVDVILERRGHPMIATIKGNYAKGITDIIRAPFKGEFGLDRVFFVNQDNWLLPAFEAILTEAKIQMKGVFKALGGSDAGPSGKNPELQDSRPTDPIAKPALKDEKEPEELRKAARMGCPFAMERISGIKP